MESTLGREEFLIVTIAAVRQKTKNNNYGSFRKN